MKENEEYQQRDEIYSKTIKAGRRTYFFDVRETKAGDYYLTMTESKRFNDLETGNSYYKKHKIFLYKEDFNEFKNILGEMTEYIIKEKGEEVISEKHNKDYKPKTENKEEKSDKKDKKTEDFTDVDFDDI